MGRWTLVIGAFLLALGLVGLADAQQRAPFAGGGGRGPTDPLALINNPSVKKELEITDEQAEKLPEALRKALNDVLTEKQVKRLKQIEMQQRGAAAFGDDKVAAALKLSEEQIGNIKTILQDSQKELKEAFSGGRGGDFKAAREKVENLKKETQEKIQDVLTSEQKRTEKKAE